MQKKLLERTYSFGWGEADLSALSAPLPARACLAVKQSRQELELKLANARLAHDGDGLRPASGGIAGGKARAHPLSRSRKWEELEAMKAASALGSRPMRDAETQATLDSITSDVASSMQESLGYTKLSGYKVRRTLSDLADRRLCRQVWVCAGRIDGAEHESRLCVYDAAAHARGDGGEADGSRRRGAQQAAVPRAWPAGSAP